MPEVDQSLRKKTSSLEIGALMLLVVIFMAASLIIQKPFGKGAKTAEALGTIIAAGLTLIMYSFIYRDNALFKIAENLYVGVTLGYGAIQIWREALRPEVYEPFFCAPTWAAFGDAALHRTVPVILGLMLVTRLSRKYGWLSRYSYGTIVGWGAGVGIPLTVHSLILKQLYPAVAPFQDAVKQAAPAITHPFFSSGWFADVGWWTQVVALPIAGSVILMIGTVAVLFYFFFSVEHKKLGGVVSKIGIWFLMVSFGASFGYTVMGRVSLLIGRVQFLLFDWLKLPK